MARTGFTAGAHGRPVWLAGGRLVAIASRFDITTLVTSTTLVPSSVWVHAMHSRPREPANPAPHIIQIEETSVPNRRRRKLSTAMSAVAALAVASPCAYFLVYESTETTERPEHHEFKQAAVLTDLPGELMSALSQGLSQFGINIPPVPSLTGSGDASTGLTGPGLTSPGLTSPGLTSPGLTDPALTSPGLTPTLPGSLAAPGTTLAPTPGVGANPALTNPALTSPTGATPGLTSPTGLDPALGGASESRLRRRSDWIPGLTAPIRSSVIQHWGPYRAAPPPPPPAAAVSSTT